MKRCPQCNRAYDDDSLRFCLEDGTVLVGVSSDSAATVLYSSAEPAKVTPSTGAFRETPLTRSTQAVTAEVGRGMRRPRADSSSNRGLTVAVVAIGLILIAIASIGVLLLWRQMPRDQSTTQSTRNDPASATSPEANRRSTSTSTPNLDPEILESSKGLRINVTASSVRYSVQSNTYVPGNVIDGSRKTAWIEGADGPGVGEWLRFDFGREINLHRIIVLPGYFKSADIWKQNNRLASATIYFSNGASRSINFPDQMERQSVDLGSVRTRWVRLEIGTVYFGSDPDTAISEVVFEWEP